MNVLYFVGGVLLYGAWGALVALGKADAHEFVGGITAGLAWLATHATVKSAAERPSPTDVVVGSVEPAGAGAAVEPAAVVAPAAVVSAAPAAVQ